MKNIDRIFFEQRNMYIDWQLSNVCNYDCLYCNDTSKGGYYTWPTLEQAIRLVDHIVKNSDHEYRTYNLLGGEPILWKHFGDLCEYIKEVDENSVIQTLTNGSRTLRWWEQYAEKMDKVVISYHAHTANREHIEQVVRILAPYAYVSVQLLADIAHFDKVMYDFDYFIEHLPGVNITPKKGQIMLGYGEWMPYTDSQLEWFQTALRKTEENNQRDYIVDEQREQKFIRTVFAGYENEIWETNNKDLTINDLNHFNGWHCNIGKDMLCVRADGTLKPSSACFDEISFGNYKTDISLKDFRTNGYVCRYDSCFCGADLEIEKWKLVK